MAKKKGSSKLAKIDLSNPEQVYAFLFFCLENITDTMVTELTKFADTADDIPDDIFEESFEEAMSGCKDECMNTIMMLNEVFMGLAPEIAIYKNWDPDALGRNLRKEFAFQLMALPEKDQEQFETDSSVIMFALGQFLQEGQTYTMLTCDDGDNQAEAQAKKLHEFLVHWTELLTQKPFPQMTKTEHS